MTKPSKKLSKKPSRKLSNKPNSKVLTRVVLPAVATSALAASACVYDGILPPTESGEVDGLTDLEPDTEEPGVDAGDGDDAHVDAGVVDDADAGVAG